VLRNRFSWLLLVTALLLVGGTAGYYLIEPEYSLFDALYMTVITLTTVGYGEVHPLSTAGRAFTIILLLGGVFTLFYAAGEFVRVLVSGELPRIIGRQRMERSLAGMNGHTIVCGYGRMGRHVCREFARQGLAFVLIDCNEDLLRDFDLAHGVAITGDATSDEVLKRAGVERARALVTVVPSDADNLYITMSARLLNDELFIVSRAEGEQTEGKLVRAGANRVVAPYAIGGSKVAHAVLRPNVVDFIDLATRTEHLELQIEETRINAGSQLAGASLSTSRLRPELGLIIVAIKKSSGAMIYTPPPTAVMEPGDTVIALGRRSQLDRLEEMARPQ
jgi:voltage-gated potassium channel